MLNFFSWIGDVLALGFYTLAMYGLAGAAVALALGIGPAAIPKSAYRFAAAVCVAASAYCAGYLAGANPAGKALRQARAQIELLERQAAADAAIKQSTNERLAQIQQEREMLETTVENYNAALQSGEATKCAGDPTYTDSLQRVLDQIQTPASGP